MRSPSVTIREALFRQELGAGSHGLARSSNSQCQKLRATRRQHFHSSGCTLARFFLAGILLARLEPARGAAWYRHANCTTPCDSAEHTCVNGAGCVTAWDSCPPGMLQSRNYTAVDHGDCMQTDCSPGGCPAGWSETAKEACFDVHACLAHAGVCFKETCCRLRTQLSCCEVLPCTVEYADCDVPQQRYLNDSSRTEIGRTRVAHTGSAVFPFYASPHVPPGASCDAARVWGTCTCQDGANVPGCDPFNSSTWAEAGSGQDGSAAIAPPLPANLSLICVVLPPPEPPPAGGGADAATSPAPPDSPGGGASGQAQGTGAPPRPPPASARSSHGGLVALIVLGCLLLGGGCVALVVWCAGLMPDLHSLRIRSLTSYEPVFTGQSYTPGLGQPGGAPADIPWTRFCAALADAYGRLRYGRRYAAERAAAAAAEERFRMLRYAPGSPMAPHGSPSSGAYAYGGAGLGPAGTAGGAGAHSPGLGAARHWLAGGPAGGSREGDEVFTLEDLGPGGSGLTGRTGAGGRAGLGYGGGGGGARVSRMGGSSGRAGSQGATGTELELGQVGPGAAGPGRAQAGRFVGEGPASGAGDSAAGGGMGGHEVIHTRALPLSDEEVGECDGHGDDDDDEEGLDAPLRLLPTPQTTGQGARPRHGGPL